MKKIIVSIPNALLAGGVVMYLKKNPDFKVYREDNPSGIEGLCIASKADVLLAEVRERPPHTYKCYPESEPLRVQALI